jgi:uncharacterized protein YPO0396
MDDNKHEEILKKFKYLEKKDIEYKAELKNIGERLKDEFECKTLGGAKEKLKKLKDKIETSNDRLDELLKKIDETTDWDKIEIEED